jgi:hypothetical protein
MRPFNFLYIKSISKDLPTYLLNILRLRSQFQVGQSDVRNVGDFIEGTSSDSNSPIHETPDQPELSDDDIQELLNQIYG